MLDPFVNLFSNLIQLYIWVLIIWTVLSMLISFEIVNRHQQLVWRIEYALNKLVEPALRPIRKYMPDLGGIDLSPVVLILGLNFLDSLLRHYLLGL